MPTVTLDISNPPSALASPADEAAFRRGVGHRVPAARPRLAAAPGRSARYAHDASPHRRRCFPERRARLDALHIQAKYDASSPASLVVFQDARFYLSDDFNAPAVFDNLIPRGDMPLTIGLFVELGDLPGEAPNARGNRSFEYDSVTDPYSQLPHEDELAR